MRATKALIHLDRLKANIGSIKARIGPKPAICVPVKADAYGHGAVRVAAEAIRAGVSCLAVAGVQEGIELREAGIDAAILLLSLPLPEELPAVAEYRLTLMISDRELAQAAAEAAERSGTVMQVHLKVDTGMGRIGLRPSGAPDLARFIASCKSLSYTGTASHFAAADSLKPGDIAYTKKQIALFRETISAIEKAGINPGITHIANSGGVVLHEDSYFDMVRPGILVYGYPPIESMAAVLPVKPVMELISTIAFIKGVKKGEYISYGRTWQAPEDTVIGTMPVGYADGLPRGLSGNYAVCLNGILYPLVGRICMDQCMVNLGKNPRVKRWDRVSLFGGSDCPVDAADIAEKMNTIPYEITCNINKRVPRVYVG